MKAIMTIGAAMALVLLSACASTGSSSLANKRPADNNTQVWYVVGGTGSSHIDERKVMLKAAEHCVARGFDGVDITTGDTVRHCREDGGPAGCSRWVISKEFVCAYSSASTTP
jgi:hypothetical protein